jgi:FkbM family methyltransferase
VRQVIARPPGLPSYPFFVHDKDDAFISTRIARTGMWEPFESTMMLRLLSCSDQFIDIGANIGWYAVAAAVRVGATGHVIAIEPDGDNFALLEANIKAAISGVSVAPVNCGLGSAGGHGTLNASSTNKGDQRVRNFVSDDEPTQSAGTVRIETLDGVLERQAPFEVHKLRIIKIDVQGFEAEVLKGSTRLLSKLPERTIIFLEFEPLLLKDNSKSACRDLIDLIASVDRAIFQICRPVRRLRRLAVADLVGFAADGNSAADLIIAHRSQFGDLRAAMPFFPRFLSRRQW